VYQKALSKSTFQQRPAFDPNAKLTRRS